MAPTSHQLLSSKMPRRYQVNNTVYLKALLEALATGDDYIETQVELTRDNLIAVTASGRYLDRAAGRYGVIRSQGAGILDSDFQTIIPLLGLSPKQISHIMLQVIDVIYGPYASHANITASLPEPYAITSGQQLILRVDNGQQIITFDASDAVNLSAATSNELATAISAKSNGTLIGSTIFDARTGNNFLNIRCRTIGSQGFLQVTGGEAQLAIEFPQVRPLAGTIATWSVANYLGTSEMIYTVIGGSIPAFQAAGVSAGDYVTITGDSGFNFQNTGTFSVTGVGANFFRVLNPDGAAETGIVQNATSDIGFYLPDLGNVLLSARAAALVETAPRQLTVILPVTSPIVKRTLRGGHHFHTGVSSVIAVTSTTVTLGSASDFPVSGGAIKPTAVRNVNSGVVSSVGSNYVVLLSTDNWPTSGAIWASNVRQFFYFNGITGNTLNNVTPTPLVALAGANVDYVNQYTYSSITGNVLNGVFPNPQALLSQEVSAGGAQLISNYPGSFIYDTEAKFITASNFTTIQENIAQGSVKTLLLVGDVSSFPATGQIVLEFGTETQEGPIKYLAKIGSTGLIIDPSHIFQYEHLTGVGLRLISQTGAYIPRVDGSDYAVYMTSTSPARDLLKNYLQLIAASGVNLNFLINSPSQKWACLPNLYTTNPTDTALS